jgi:hypothetical protein
MSRRPLLLAALAAFCSLTACGNITGPVRSTSVTPGTSAELDVAPVCRVGGWNYSTGRCE